MLKLLKFLNDKLTWLLNLLMVVLMSLMTVLVVAQVFFRCVLLKPLSWSEELAGYLFSGVFFFGAVLLYRESRHINMSLLVESIKSRFGREVVTFIAHLFVGVMVGPMVEKLRQELRRGGGGGIGPIGLIIPPSLTISESHGDLPGHRAQHAPGGTVPVYRVRHRKP